MLESQLERKLRDEVKAKGGLALKFVSPGTVGVPDRIVLAPDGRVANNPVLNLPWFVTPTLTERLV